jgi:hypothetical protein
MLRGERYPEGDYKAISEKIKQLWQVQVAGWTGIPIERLQ